MTTTQTKPGAIPSFGTLKMEDRKRSLALDGEDLAPSRKRVLKDENGQAMRMDTEKEKDIEVCPNPPLTHPAVSPLTWSCAELPKGCHLPPDEGLQEAEGSIRGTVQ